MSKNQRIPGVVLKQLLFETLVDPISVTFPINRPPNKGKRARTNFFLFSSARQRVSSESFCGSYKFNRCCCCCPSQPFDSFNSFDSRNNDDNINDKHFASLLLVAAAAVWIGGRNRGGTGGGVVWPPAAATEDVEDDPPTTTITTFNWQKFVLSYHCFFGSHFNPIRGQVSKRNSE